MMYRSVMSRSKQNLLSNMSVVLRRQDLSVTDSVSPWKNKIKIHFTVQNRRKKQKGIKNEGLHSECD